MSPPRRHICAASNDASPLASIPMLVPSLHCSSAAGTPLSQARSRSQPLRNRLGIAIAKRAYKAYHELLGSARSQRIYNEGARPQRLLWASTGTKDPAASDILYIKALAAPFTVNTMPEGTVKAFADHGDIGDILPADGGDCEDVLAQFGKAGVDIDALAAKLQNEGAKSFVKSWDELMKVISAKSEVIAKAS